MKTHSDENFQVLECRSVRKQRKYGNNAPVYCCVSSVWVPSDRSAVSDPSPGVTATGLAGPRDEHNKEAGRFLRTGWPLLWLLSSVLKPGRRDWDPARALPNCGSRLNFSFTTSDLWENSVSKVVSKWELIKGGRNDNRVHLLKCDEGSLLCSLFLFLFFFLIFIYLAALGLSWGRLDLSLQLTDSSCIMQAQ